MRKDTSSLRRPLHGFTLVELLVVIGIIALLIAILLPSLNKARQVAMSVACASNMRQTGVAMQAYLTEHRNAYPQQAGDTAFWLPLEQRTWFGAIARHLGWSRPYAATYDAATGTIGHCPNHFEQPGAFSYTANVKIINNFNNTGIAPVKATQIRGAAGIIWLFESHDLDNRWPFAFNGLLRGKRPFFQTPPNGAHGQSINYLFCDGHVAGYPASDLYPDPTGDEFNPFPSY